MNNENYKTAMTLMIRIIEYIRVRWRSGTTGRNRCSICNSEDW